MSNTPNRGYPIPDPAGAIHPGVRDLAVAIDTDLNATLLPGWLPGYNVKNFGAVGDGSTNDRTALNTLVNTTLANGGEVFFPPGDYLLNSTLTFPDNTRLWFAKGARLKPANSVTPIILAHIPPTPYQIFTNILSGQGAISFAGNKKIAEFLAAWWGVVGDDTTDCSAILNRITNQFSTDNLSVLLRLPIGRVLLAGALLDTGVANAQWVLPARTIAGGQLSLRLAGTGDPSTMNATSGESGTILRSSLSSGSGAMIGCKSGDTFGSSQLNLWVNNLTFQMPVNPTNSCLDFRYIKRVFMQNFKLWCGESSNYTQPTSSGSFGLRTPTVDVVSDCSVTEGVVGGFYNNIEVNELAYLHNIQEVAGVYGYTFPHNLHPVMAGRIGSFFSTTGLRFTGEASVRIQQFNIERAAETGKWYSKDQHIADLVETTSGDARGHIYWLISDALSSPSVTDNAFVIGGGVPGSAKNIKLEAFHSANLRDYNYIDPFTGIRSANPAVFEINAKKATSADTDYAVLELGTEQSGTSNLIAFLHFVNSALAVSDKRVAQIAVVTDGATNSGRMNLAVYNAGTQQIVLSLTALKNVVLGTGALSTSASDGFLYIPSCAGAPTGTPSSFTGRVPIVYDSTNNKVYVYNGAWKSATLA